MLDPSQVRQFEEEGWLKLTGLLDPDVELAALRTAYVGLIEELARAFYARARAPLPPGLHERPLGECFARLQGASGGHAVEHLDPLLTAFEPSHQRHGGLPSAQLPELFELSRAEPLLDALESLIGPEIQGSPIHHLNFKLAPAHLALERETAREFGRPNPARRPFHDFHVDRTGWHCDAPFGLSDAHDSDIVVAWLPMLPAGGELGTLTVLPGSHRDRHAARPTPERFERDGIAVSAEPGDVVLFHNWLYHGSTPNRSCAGVRWTFSFRYLPRGQPSGRPYLPSVLLRSRSEPHREFDDPKLWQAMWRRALDHLARPGTPTPQVAGLERAQAITADWRRRAPDPEAWLRLEPDRGLVSWLRTRRSLRSLSRALRRRGRPWLLARRSRT